MLRGSANRRAQKIRLGHQTVAARQQVVLLVVPYVEDFPQRLAALLQEEVATREVAPILIRFARSQVAKSVLEPPLVVQKDWYAVSMEDAVLPVQR